ncbi:MAG TPA: hypothetical protein VK880_05400 [Anaerolineales bacterium]|nr:hypothetical protein [Anaerolineales bacterium]
MKQIRIAAAILLFTTLACSLIPAVVQTSTPTLSPPVIASPTVFLTAEPSAPPILEEADGTNLPPVTVPAPAASPQPAVAHHHPDDPIAPDRIAMIDALNGWAISGADVLFTTDGAQTWREATPPEVLTPGSQVQAQGTFLDSDHAWVVFSFDNQIPASAVVWHTSDSGQTWTSSASLEHQAYGEQVWAEFFALDAAHLWLMVRGVYLGAGTHYATQFLRSVDGGRTWLPLTGDVGVDYTGMVFADPNHGLITWQTAGFYAPSPPEYALTSDGALNWDVRQLPPPADAANLFETSPYCEPFQPHMLSSRSIHLLVGCFDEHDPPQVFNSYLYSSEDGGSTWTSIPLPEKVLAHQAALSFFDEDNALLLGRDIYRSAVGGLRWEYVKSVHWDAQFSFVDPQTGWAIARANGQTALVKTSNGGAAWVEIKPVVGPWTMNQGPSMIK